MHKTARCVLLYLVYLISLNFEFLGLCFPTKNCLLKQSTVQFNRTRRIVISRHGIRYKARIAARVDYPDGRDVHLRNLRNSDVRLEDVVESREEDDEVGHAGHEAVLDRGVGESAAAPVRTVCILAAFDRSALDERHSLLVPRHEHDDAGAERNVRREVQSVAEQRLRLLQIDDVDAESVSEDERQHVRVADTDLVTEMDASSEQIFHRHKVTDSKEVWMIEGIYDGLVFRHQVVIPWFTVCRL